MTRKIVVNYDKKIEKEMMEKFGLTEEELKKDTEIMIRNNEMDKDFEIEWNIINEEN